VTSSPAQTAPPLPVRFDLLANVSHAISTRLGGASPAPYHSLNLGVSTGDDEHNVLTNRERFFSHLNLALDDVMTARLTHGSAVSVFAREANDQPVRYVPVREGSKRWEGAFHSDAMISNVSGLHAMFTFADCVPLAFFDRKTGAVGGAHAGWRGTAQAMGPQVVRAMTRHFGSDPRDIVAGIGPSIGPCCYSVGREVADRFSSLGTEAVLEPRGSELYLDLWTTNQRQLVASGLTSDSIEISRICTSCHVDTFFSHRAEGGRTGRFGLCIGIPAR